MADRITFSDLNINNALYNALEEMGYKYPTTIQHKTFPVAMSGRDICGIAQTGTGKTLAYLLPLIRLWNYDKEKDPQVVILVPTRELVAQVVDVINALAKFLSLDAVGVYGGVNINTQKLELKKGADFIVATPGRFYDLIMHGAFKVKNIKKLVVDEMDEMLNLGFRTQINNIIDKLPEKRQNLFFSATINDEVEDLMDRNFNNPIKIEAAPAGSPLENIEQSCYEAKNFNTKINLLTHFLKDKATYTKVLVFTSSKKYADILFEAMEERFPQESGVIHSNKDQNHRFRTVNNFTEGIHRFIIATDIVARGIDVAEVSHVFNMDMPEIADNYIHRIGRTGRADRKGVAITFFAQTEMENKEAIEALMNYKIPQKDFPADVEVSDILVSEELPKRIIEKEDFSLVPKVQSGPAFHEKLAKNKKVNVKVTRAEKMQKKYGKPITRSPKMK